MTLQFAAGITLVYSSTDEGEYNPMNYALIYGMWFLIVTGAIVPYCQYFPPTTQQQITNVLQTDLYSDLVACTLIDL
jgi:hypothetical protein